MKNFFIKDIQKNEEDVLSLEEAKLALRVTTDHDDLLINSLLHAALEFAEQYIGRYIQKRQITALFNSVSTKEILLSDIGILAVKMIKINNSEDEILREGEGFTFCNNKILLHRAYKDKNLEIIYISGFEVLPESIKQGILLHLYMLYDKEVMDKDMKESLLLLYKPFRNLRIF